MKRLFFVSLALVGMMTMAHNAHAQLTALTPGTSTSSIGSINLTGLTLVGEVVTGGSLTTTISGGPSGTFNEWVYKTGTGTLDFMYQVTLAGNSDDLASLSVTHYAGFTTSVGILSVIPPGGSSSTLYSPQTIGVTATGDAVNFGYNTTNLLPGETTAVLVVATNATATTAGTLQTINSGVSQTPAIGPAVPEPSTMAIAGIGALGLIGYGLRRRKALGA